MKYAIITFGCRVNQADSFQIEEGLIACGGTPAFAQYRDGGQTPWAIIMLDLDGDRIVSMTSYLDVQTLFPRFGLPLKLAA